MGWRDGALPVSDQVGAECKRRPVPGQGDQASGAELGGDADVCEHADHGAGFGAALDGFAADELADDGRARAGAVQRAFEDPPVAASLLGQQDRHTVQLCIHCREDPAGFWVSHKNAETVRRPWCLSCCDVLDPARYNVVRFGS